MRKLTYPGPVNGFNVHYSEPDICPICHHAIKPTEMFHHYFHNNDDEYFLTFLYLCESCLQTFLTLHTVVIAKDQRSQGLYNDAKIIYIAPEKFLEKSFDDKLEFI